MKRRDFFKYIGGGILISFSPIDFLDLVALPPEQRRQLPKDYNAFLLIGEDGKVKAFTGKIEMGQGPITSLPQMLADELDVNVEMVEMVMGDTALCPYDRGTFGSLTTRQFGPPFRAAAAEARAVLLELGSERLGADVSKLEIENGIIRIKSDRSKIVSYAELAKGKRIERFMEAKPDVKEPSEFRVMGKSRYRVDSVEKVTGKAKFSGDFIMDGMLYARIVRPPSHGAEITNVDTREAEKIDGLKVVRLNGMLALLHELPDRLDEAMSVVKAEYKYDEKVVNDKTIFKYLLNSKPGANNVDDIGDIDRGREQSDKVFENEYLDGYVAHAPMEPHTALAYWEDDVLIIRGSTQTPFPAQSQVAGILDLEPEKVRVITPYVGGGFGGKSANGQIVEAARLANATKKPVMVVWTREEEFFNDTFRPAAVVKLNSGVDKNGKISFWDFNVYFAGQRGSDTIYDVPNINRNVYSARGVHPFATGAWRAPANNTNTFARESQIEIMAAAAGIDPLEFRLNNLADEKMIAVLKAAADKFGWTPARGPSGRGYGIACGTDAGTWVVNIAEVDVNKKTGEVKVIRVVSAQDMGLCVNPQGSIIQMEGCITMGMGYALSEDIHFEGGKLLDTNFDTYQLPLFSWVPDIECVILDRPNEPATGGGEPAIINMGGCIANAIFDACGARLFQMPMTPERVLEALA